MTLTMDIDGQTKLKVLADGCKTVVEPSDDDAVLAALAILKQLVNQLQQHPAAIRDKVDVYQRAVKWAARNPRVIFRPGDMQSCGYASNAVDATSICFRLLADGIVRQIVPRRSSTGRPPGPRFEVIGEVQKDQSQPVVISTKATRKFFQTMNALAALKSIKP